MKAIKKIFIVANILLFIATVMSYMAPYINPTKAWIFSFFATAYFWMLVLNIVFISIWAVFKNKSWLLSFFAILLGVNHLSSYFSFSFDSTDGQDIRIMTFNVGGGHAQLNESSAKDYEKKLNSLMTENQVPDIVCIQEAGYSKFFLDKLSYKYYHKVGGNVILSEYEIKDKGVIKFEKTLNRIVWADLLIKDQIIRVINMHLQSNKVSEQAEDLVNNPDLREKETWVDMKSVIGKIKRATNMRTDQAQKAKSFIANSPYPTLVVGDFNDTPLSYTYRLLAEGYQDAFKEKGKGIGITYGGAIPGLRIDYMLASKDIDFKSYDCPKVDLSDHYPIICSFDF